MSIDPLSEVPPQERRAAAHPLERFSRRTRRRLFGITAYVSLVVLWAFWWLGPRATTGSVADLSTVDSTARAVAIVGGWTSKQLAIARGVVIADFALIPIYVTAISLVCLWPTIGRARLHRAGRVAAWAIFGGGLSDVVEDVALLRVMSAPSSRPWVSLMRIASTVKWVVVTATMLFGAVVLVVAAIDWFRGIRNVPGRDPARKQEIRSADEAVQSSASAMVVRVTPSAVDDPSPGGRLLAWLKGQRVEPVIPARQAAAPVEGQLGISLSGGGIRSASMNLGTLQELERADELQRAAYLTAVSGGSYIAAAHEILRSRAPAGSAAPWAPGTPEEEYLRYRTTYLAPGVWGKVNALWRLVRGLITNVAVIGAVLCVTGLVYGAALLGPHLMPSLAHCPHRSHCRFDLPTWVVILLASTLTLAVGTGLWDLLVRPAKDSLQRFLEAWSIRLLLLTVGAALLLWLAPWLLTELRTRFTVVDAGREHLDWRGLWGLVAGWGASLGALSGLAGISALGVIGRTKPTSAQPGVVKRAAVGAWSVARAILIRVLVAILGPLLAIAVFMAFAFSGAIRASEFRTQLTLIVAASLLAWVLAYGDLTRWSLHPYYKRRLSTVFALERVQTPDGSVVAREVPYDEPVGFTDLSSDRPQLVISAAANVSDYGAAPVSRKVVPFTFSRDVLYGGRALGQLPMSEYQGATSTRNRDVSVRAAVAMSGAALSPSMGKQSRWWATFLLAVANVRLGVWLPNPRAIRRELDGGRPVRHRAGPHYLAWELLGRNSYRDDYVYVTDGGHLENLGLVELLRRGCSQIYCFDAAGDETDSFNTFGEAVAIARSEVGVEIEIDPFVMAPANDEVHVPVDVVAGKLWFEGDREQGVASGRIVLAKAGVTDDAPPDVRAWETRDTQFPTHGTADQLYPEERFEAYRALGAHIARHAIGAMTAPEPEPEMPAAAAVDGVTVVTDPMGAPAG